MADVECAQLQAEGTKKKKKKKNGLNIHLTQEYMRSIQYQCSDKHQIPGSQLSQHKQGIFVFLLSADKCDLYSKLQLLIWLFSCLHHSNLEPVPA